MALALVKPSIAELRELIGAQETPLREKSAFTLMPEGLPKRSLIELTGPGKTEFVATFLREHPDFKVAWVESQITINPYALLQKGVELSNVLFVEGGEDCRWCLTQALQSGCFQAVVAEDRQFVEQDLRRFQLLSEKGRNHFFLLSEKLHQSWVPHLQIEIGRDRDALRVDVVRRRGFA